MNIDIKKCGVKPYNNEMSLYIHIPFCISKCTYCNFCSFADKNKFIPQYTDALCTEIELKAQEFGNYLIKSIYIGGGTPSVLPLGSITKILDCVRKNFKLNKKVSITVEGNPNSLTKDKLQEFFDAGVNRLSIGLQSTSEHLLKLLNRPHTTQQFVDAVKTAQDIGFKNISADIIIGVPTQTMQDVEDTLNVLFSLNLKHISAYGLILEPGTPLYKMVKSAQLKQLPEDLQNNMYDFVVERLKQKGFNRYEISNFAKHGFESVHNINYWQRGQYLGIGLDAYSFVGGLHWQNTNILEDYIKQPNKKIKTELETMYTAKLETIMLGLRMDSGLDLQKFNADFNTDFVKEYNYVLENLLNNKLVKIQNNHLIITDQHISNAIISEFA